MQVHWPCSGTKPTWYRVADYLYYIIHIPLYHHDFPLHTLIIHYIPLYLHEILLYPRKKIPIDVASLTISHENMALASCENPRRIILTKQAARCGRLWAPWPIAGWMSSSPKVAPWPTMRPVASPVASFEKRRAVGGFGMDGHPVDVDSSVVPFY